MKRYSLQMVFICCILFSVGHAQVRTANQTYNNQKQTYKPPPKTLSSTSDSLKMAMNDVKTSFNNLFKARRDTISIMIQNIEYDDANHAALKDYLKKSKGVKAVIMQYRSATAIMEVMFRGKSTELWDELPRESKDPFKLIEASENNITLKYKNEKTTH